MRGMTRVLVLDDYQDVARTLAPWNGLAAIPELADLTLDVRTSHLEDRKSVV